MKYYTLCVQEFKDGSEPKKSLYTYDNETESVARYHTFLGSYMGGENIHSVMSTVTDAKGAQIASMYWEEPAEKAEDIVVEE